MKIHFLAAALIVSTSFGVHAQTKAPAPAAKPAVEKPAPTPQPDLIKAGLGQLDAKDYPAALKSFNDAYVAGKPDGAFYLGRMVELGVGIQAEPEKARLLYMAAADKGSAKALNRVGLMSFRGEDTLQDYKAARELICKGADLGDVDALFNCAGMMAQGQGGTKDTGKALELYAKAAEQGHIGATNALGFAQRDGVSGAPDPAKAKGYFEKTAMKGNPVGLFELATMFETGVAAERDLPKAHLYYNLASARQHPQGPEALQRVSATLNSEDIEKAQSAARAWKATP